VGELGHRVLAHDSKARGGEYLIHRAAPGAPRADLPVVVLAVEVPTRSDSPGPPIRELDALSVIDRGCKTPTATPGRLVQIPAEVDLDAADLVAVEAVDLGVADRVPSTLVAMYVTRTSSPTSTSRGNSYVVIVPALGQQRSK